MRWKLSLATCLVLLVILLGAVGCEGFFSPTPRTSSIGGAVPGQQNTGIWVTGEGKVSVTPDVAVLNLGVEAQAKTVASAQEQAVEAMEAVMDELDKSSVADKDIKTQRFSIYPVRRWENDREILLGYRVTNIVTVKVMEIDDTGAIIDRVAAVGGDYTRINDISFTVDNPTEYYEAVRQKAMEDAAKQEGKEGS